jgi:phosphate transport system permease protein
LGKFHRIDAIYRFITGTIGNSIILFMIVAVVVLTYAGYPSIMVNGFHFFTSTVWRPNPPNGKIITVNGFQTLSGSSFGVLVFVADTLASSAIALILAIPASLGIAIFLTQIAPRKIAAPISFMVELLAGIPSVIYGFWGFVVLSPFLFQTLEPYLAQHLSFIPIFAPPVQSPGLLAAGIILAIMVVPIIASISRDFMARTPIELKEGAKALGLTKWEVTRKVIIPYARTGIIGSVVLGLGRALGETMAVAMVSGAAGIQALPTSLYFPVNTIASWMALSLDSAFTDPSGMAIAALMEMAIVLLVITVTVNVIARVLIKQTYASSAENIVRV